MVGLPELRTALPHMVPMSRGSGAPEGGEIAHGSPQAGLVAGGAGGPAGPPRVR